MANARIPKTLYGEFDPGALFFAERFFKRIQPGYRNNPSAPAQVAGLLDHTLRSHPIRVRSVHPTTATLEERTRISENEELFRLQAHRAPSKVRAMTTPLLYHVVSE